MKKIIIAILLLIPLIVILTISASGKIISAEVAISIETFELWHKGEQVTEATVNLGEYKKKNLRYQLIPRYYPAVAQVSGFSWSSDNPTVATVDKDGIVSFHECGFAKVTAVSLDNTTVRASCSFFVEDDEIHSLTCHSGGDEPLTSLSMQVYGARQIRVDVMPYSAFVGDLEWTSSDTSVLTVSSNGVVKALKEGSADIVIRASSKNGKTVEKTLPVTVAGTSPVKQKHVYLYGDGETELAPYLSAGSLAVDLSEIAFGAAKTYAVLGGEITVHRLTYQKMLGMADLDLMKEGEWKDGVYIAADRSVAFTPIDLATSQAVEGVTAVSSNSGVLTVEQGKFKAHAAGKATVTFKKAGYEDFAMEINVAIPISYFSLNFDADEDIVGIECERVYGTKSIYDGVVTNGIRVSPENVYPATGSRTLFSYSVAENYASVDQNGFVTFSDAAVGKTVTVTVKSLFSTNNMSRTYAFRNIVKGVNVGFGFGGNTFNAEKNEKPSFAPYYDAVKTMYEARDVALVFQTNIYMPDRETVDAIGGEYTKISLIRDIYGNGYKIDGQFYEYDYESHIFSGTSDDQLEPWQKAITITNLFINSYAPVGDDSKETFDALMEKGGEPIRSFYKERTDFRITFRYCVFQYSYSHACLIGGTFEFDGCVFRNSAGVSLMIQSLHGQENYVTINNCIFSNSISMTGIVSNGDFPAKEGDVVRYNQVAWTGDNYIYNWKKVDEIRLDIIPRGLMKNDQLDKLLEGVNDKLSECARVSFGKSMNASLVVQQGDDTYVNMGMYFMGYWAPVNPIINKERSSITEGTALRLEGTYAAFTELKLNSTPLGVARSWASELLDFDAKSYMLTNLNEEDGTFNTTPGETYKLNKNTYERLKGRSK